MSSPIILASSSPFRKQLLNKFQIPFKSFSPEIDESHKSNETPQQLVARLAIEKAQASKKLFTQGWAIGSDQVALFDNQIIGKPHTVENAHKQLAKFSGNKVTFLTGLALYDIEKDKVTHCVEVFTVYFKQLSPQQIATYIEKEQPLHCAGSFKSEGLGITLFDRLEGDDPNTLIGLPLIALNRLFLSWGFDVLAN